MGNHTPSRVKRRRAQRRANKRYFRAIARDSVCVLRNLPRVSDTRGKICTSRCKFDNSFSDTFRDAARKSAPLLGICLKPAPLLGFGNVPKKSDVHKSAPLLGFGTFLRHMARMPLYRGGAPPKGTQPESRPGVIRPAPPPESGTMCRALCMRNCLAGLVCRNTYAAPAYIRTYTYTYILRIYNIYMFMYVCMYVFICVRRPTLSIGVDCAKKRIVTYLRKVWLASVYMPASARPARNAQIRLCELCLGVTSRMGLLYTQKERYYVRVTES